MTALEVLGDDALEDIAAVHVAAFPDAALSRLGREAVRRYYRWQLHGPHDATIVGVRDAGQLAAFCAAGVYRGVLSGFVRRERAFLVRLVLRRPWLLGGSFVRERAALALRLLFGRHRNAHSNLIGSPFGVLSIAVAPTHRRRGLGALLLHDALERARASGHTSVELTVDPGNEGALDFYAAEGWRRVEVTPRSIKLMKGVDPL